MRNSNLESAWKGALALVAACMVFAASLEAQSSAKATGEVLKYRLLWPSGVAMGEAQLSSSVKNGNRSFEFRAEAELPVYPLSSVWTSVASLKDTCSMELHRRTTEGAKIAEETLTFNPQSLEAKRKRGDAVILIATPACARDPLAFLFYFIDRMRDKGPVAEGTFFINADQKLGIHSGGTEDVTVGGSRVKAEKFSVDLHGGRKEAKFDIWISQDGRGIPVLVKLPTPLAVFSAELVQ